MELTAYHSMYFAHELTRRHAADSGDLFGGGPDREGEKP